MSCSIDMEDSIFSYIKSIQMQSKCENKETRREHILSNYIAVQVGVNKPRERRCFTTATTITKRQPAPMLPPMIQSTVLLGRPCCFSFLTMK